MANFTGSGGNQKLVSSSTLCLSFVFCNLCYSIEMDGDPDFVSGSGSDKSFA
jgi:hypothetical protein